MLTLTGGATGLFCGYVDFIAWDIRTALQMAKEFFEDSDIPWASFHTFRREAGTVNLKTPPEEEPDDEEQVPELDETLTGMDYIPYTPQNVEEFFAQIEQWNDEDEYTRCIQALNAFPEDWRNYRTAYAMARALENYAIIGDHDEGTPRYKGCLLYTSQIEKWNDADEFARCIEAIEAIPEQERGYLLTVKLSRAYSNLAVLGDHGVHGTYGEVDGDLIRHAIDLLESIRAQGENDPYWNSRMGYSCLMAYRSAATAYEYAKCWLALTPDDPAAQKLVRDCEEYLEEEKALELDLKEREEIIRKETPDDVKGVSVNEQ